MDGEFTTLADFDYKKVVMYQLVIASYCYVDYKARPHKLTEDQARKAIGKLAALIAEKLYVLNDKDAVNYISYFELHPDKFHLFELGTTLVILRRCCQKLGLTKFESFTLPRHKAFMDMT